MSENKKSPLGIALFVIALAGVAVLFGFYQRANVTTSQAIAAETAEAPKTEAPQATLINPTPIEETAAPAELNIEQLGTPRILGNPDAPIKISEHSSFTCGGCAAFHRDNYKRIKSDYIDTGKAYIVYDDFPRNREDVIIGSIARCIPDDAYFNFVQVVFETQRDWVVLGEKYLGHIKNTALFAGGDQNTINACAEKEELHKVLAQRRDDASKKHGIDSTPTLIINDTTKISGLLPYKDIQKALDAALTE